MVRHVWDQRRDHIIAATRDAKRQIARTETQIDALLTRIMNTANAHVIKTYETKLAELEKQKARLVEHATQTTVPPTGFEEKLEPVLLFRANPPQPPRQTLANRQYRRASYHPQTGLQTPPQIYPK